jgi:hypothetical protein
LNGSKTATNVSQVFIALAKSIFSDSSTSGEIQKICLPFSSSDFTKFSTSNLSDSFLTTFV